MKIAFFTDVYLDLTGGIVSSINSQKKALEKLGHTVYVFSTGFYRSKTEIEKLAKQNIYLVPTCKVFFIGLVPISRRPKIIEKWILKNFPEIKDFDVFHCHYEAGCSIAGIRLGKKLNIPVVQTMHGREDMGEENLIPYGLKTFVAKNLNLFHSWYLSHDFKISRDNYLANTSAKRNMWELMVNHANAADVVLAPSKHFKDKLIHYGVNKKIDVLPNGFNDELIIKNCKPIDFKKGEPLKIIWHSRVSAEKRMMVFLKALTMVEGDFCVDVYGGGGDYFRAKRFARRNSLNVKFYNTTPFDIVYKKLQQSHLDILISYNFDTFGMTLIEAQSVGVPTLFCDPDMREILPEGSYIMSKNENADEIANSINNLIKHPESVKKMSEILLCERDNILQSKYIEELIKIYKEVIK